MCSVSILLVWKALIEGPTAHSMQAQVVPPATRWLLAGFLMLVQIASI